MDIQQFWRDCRNEEASIKKVIAEPGSLQPSDGSIYITSVFNRELMTKAGDTVLTTIKLGAQRIIEGGHRLSDNDAISAHQAEHARRREAARHEPAPDGRRVFRAVGA